MRKIILIIIGVFVLAVVMRIVFSKKGNKKEIEKETITVEVIPAEKGTVKKTCEMIGTVMADKTAQVFPETMGRITRILVKEGSYVNKDDYIIALKNETIGFEFEEGFIRAPISGFIAKIMIDVGSLITPQTLVAIVVDFSRVKVAFNAPEVDASCIAKETKVLVRVDAQPDQTYQAKISEISPVVDPMTRTIGVKAVVDNPRRILKPGMTARVIVSLGEKKDVIVIPEDALLDSYLFVVKDSTAQRRDVQVGLIGDDNIEITSGLNQGELIIVAGQERLAGGEKVATVLRGK